MSPLSPAQIVARVESGGIVLAGLTLHSAGADNVVFAARTADGLRVVVKSARSDRGRFATAAWATSEAARRGIPVPRVLWHDERLCVEERARGRALAESPDQLDTSAHSPSANVVVGARELGTVLRRLHSIAVRGHGPLSALGVGTYPSLAAALSASALRLAAHPSSLLAVAGRALTEHGPRLVGRGPRLLHGDMAARHTFVDIATGTITALVDWESVRGGDPLSDVAAFSVREHPCLAAALLREYFPAAGPSEADVWALTVHRIRIAAALTRFHHDQGEHVAAARMAAILTADLVAVRNDAPSALPALTRQEQQP